EKTIRACKSHSAESAALAGGVASNSGLRRVMRDACAQHGIRLHIPKPEYCTDNAAMIAACGYFKWKQGKFSSLDLNANPDLPWESSCGPK
ncbi:MAG: tRNA (adenosine(37)-N6)-threonylcarbamoyltransferase complex transferase subunit TsaD, partial [Clostridiales bacterium]|nr:tRNA (adenosine(37)-N6)-threonylcarbamoyltransferase complex transferase subunit TsaD [Clostridiales bacterium]